MRSSSSSACSAARAALSTRAVSPDSSFVLGGGGARQRRQKWWSDRRRARPPVAGMRPAGSVRSATIQFGLHAEHAAEPSPESIGTRHKRNIGLPNAIERGP